MSVEPVREHPWRVSPTRAREIQTDLRKHIVVEPLPCSPQVVAGIDVSVRNGEARAAVVLLSLPGLSPLQAVTASRPATFPYVPGLLAFREGPVILDALEKLTTTPDVLIFDAHGLAHPRRFGLATHLGVLLDVPSVGCAKSPLCGDYAEPSETRGSWTPIRSERNDPPRRAEDADGPLDVIGAVVRTREGVKPVFVSIGHRADLASAVSLILRCAPRYRLPETTRWAHRVAGGGSLPDRLAQPKQGRP